jgi:uncharacterized membrane protein YfhO
VDAYAPGWKAWVDGRPAPLLPANTSFRAVAVPAGRNEVEMRYRPPEVMVGAVVSALALLAFALVLRRRCT